MQRKQKHFIKSGLALLLAIILSLQGTQPIFVLARDSIENEARDMDFSEPEALTAEEAGIEKEDVPTEEAEQQTTDAPEESEQQTPDTPEEMPETQGQPDESQPEESQPTEEVELKEPVEYYPIPEEPEGELVDYDKDSKTYKTGEKEYTTVIGGYVGTYEDSEGEMQLVDNTLVEPKARTRSVIPAESYENKANDYTVQLPKNITEEAGIKIQRGSYDIEIVPLSGDYSHSAAKDNAILYNQVYEGIDVQYTVLDSSIKEDIVLHKPVEQSIFEYELRIPGLKAELKDNQVYLYPEEKAIEESEYILEAPSMEDAAGAVDFKIELELREEDGKTILAVKPNQEWLASEERQYPIRIDPSTVNIGKEAFNMNGVEQGSPNAYIGDNNYPYVGYDDGIKSGNLAGFGTMHMICRTYIKVNSDFSAIPKDSKIDSATFSVSQRTAYSGGASQFGLYRVDDSWSLPLKWKNQPYNHTFIDVQNAVGTRNAYINYNVKDLVNDWVQGTYANNGMVLKAIDEAAGLAAAMQCEVLNNRNSVYGPKITVQWSPAEDPYLRDMSIDDTTVLLRPMTEKNLNGKLKFDAVFADGIAKSKSTVEYYLTPDEEAKENHHTTDAKPLYSFPDSTEFNKQFPEANKYYSKDSNWQSALYAGLTKDKLYTIKAQASKEIDGEMVIGKEVTSDSFVIYEVKQYDTFPKIAKYYGIPLVNIMKDNQVQDALVVANNTIFIRNPKTNVPYNPPPLTDIDKMKIDGALMGRGLHCEFGFEPVNLNTGNFYMNQTDVSMKELDGEFGIGRTYNSKGTDRNSMFGRGWSFDYDHALSQLEDGTILYMRGDGSVLFFTKNEDGTYTAPDGYVYDLKPVSYEGTDHDEIGWEIKDADQSVWSFDKYGMLRFVINVDGFKTKLDYDEEYNLSKITTASGKEFGIKQNERGYISGITLPDGGKLAYEYDDNGNLIKHTNANGGTIQYKYDDKSRMTSWKDENGNTVVKNTYDDEGRVITQTDANGGEASFEYGDGQTTTIDNEGNKTVYRYDESYRTTSITHPDGTKTLKSYNDENQLAREVTTNGSKTYTYDQFGNIATETREDGATASYSYNEQNKLSAVTGYDGNTVTYEYDDAGNVTASTKPDGTRNTYVYDDQHRMISQTDGRGITTTYSYDGPNLVSYVDGEGHTWTFGYDAMNRSTTMSDPLGNTTVTTYDARGKVISQTAADGGVTAYSLDGVGNIQSITDAMGHVSSFEYDKLYNILKGTDPEGNTITYKYDKNNQEIEAADAAGNTITYTRDSMGRVIEETNKDFGTKLYEYDQAGNLIKYTDGNGNSTLSESNKLGLVTKTTDAVGNVMQYSFDALGNETEAIHADGGSYKTIYDSCGRVIQEIDELGAVVNYTYDANGNILTMSDDSGRTYTYTYDNNNNKISETNPEGGVSTFTYDAAGRQTSYTNEEGQTESYTYDAAGRVTSTKNALEQVYTNEYDLNGKIVKSTDENGNATAQTYDGTGNLTSVTDPLGNITAMKYDALGNIAETIDALKGKTAYEYDSMGNSTKMTDALGNTFAYKYDKAGNNTSITLPTGDKVKMSYDAIGQLIQCEDAQGLIIKYQYDGMGRMVKSEDNGGNSMTYVYDAAGNVISQTDQLDRTATYTYDIYGRLTELEEADGSITTYEYDSMDRITAVTDAEGHRTAFAYDKVGNQLSMTKEDEAVYQFAYDKKNRIISETNPLGASRSFKYDANDNLLEVVDENGTKTTYAYDANDNLIKQTDGNGNTTTFAYDELDRKIKETSPQKEVSEYRYDAINNLTKYKDPMELITEYKYDSLSNLTEEISPKGAVTKYSHDKHGNVISVTDPKGSQTTYSVDLNDNVTKMTMANGGEYSYSYDAAGRIKSMTSPLGYKKNFSYDAADNLVKETDSLKSTTTYVYDKVHNLKSSTNPLDGTNRFEYDKFGNLVKETDPLGRSRNYSYDLAGRMLKAADPQGKVTELNYDPVGNVTSMTKPGGRTTQYGYDKNYNVTSVTDPMGYVAQKLYDKSNRITEETDALNQKTSYSYDKNGRVTSITNKLRVKTGFEYDPHGNIIVMQDRTGLKTNLEYDVNDNLTRVTDPLGGITNYGYDNMNNLVTFTNAAGKRTDYSYDLEGNLTSITDPGGRTESFGYDEKGRLTSHTGGSGKKTSYDYDKLNDFLEKSYEDASGKETDKKVSYTYNNFGERVSMKDAAGKSTYEYDELGRISKVVDGSGKAVSYVYDEADNLQQVIYPDDTKVSYEYDLNDNLVKVTDRKGKVTEYKHDALNRVTETIRPNGTKTTIAYDAEDHVTKLANECSSCAQAISSYEYKYNAQGYIISETATELEAGTRKEPSWEDWYNWGGSKKTEKTDCCHEEKTVKTNRTYEYDDNWELTRCTEKVEGGKKTVHNYTYDKVGNRTYYEKIVNGVQKVKYKYEYNDSNQLICKKDCNIWGDKGIGYEYDADGNLIRSGESKTGRPTEYEYTAENRLAVVKEGDTVLMAALYDGDGNRVFQIDNTYKWEDCYEDEVLIPESQRTVEGNSPEEQLASVIPNGVNAKGYTLTKYINDINQENAQVLMEYSASDAVRQAYTYGETRVSVDKAEETSYYMNDGRFSVTGLVTEANALTNSYRYDPYGNLVSGTADAVNYYGYNAESTNTNTGFQYLRARYYNPATGTMTTEDTETGTQQNPLTRSRYAYVTNNPVNYQDPSGHFLKKLWNGVKKVAKKVVKTVKNVAKKVVNTVKKAAKWVVNAVTNTKKTIEKAVDNVKKTAKKTYQKAVSAGSRFVQSVGNGIKSAGRKLTKTYTSFKSYVAERTAEIKETVVRELCTTANRITDALGKVDWKQVGITAAALAVSAGVVALTGGAALAALPAMGGLGTAIAGGAITGAIGGAAFSGTSSLLSGESAGEVVEDTLLGGLTGGLTGGVLGGLGYGAGKLINGAKNLVNGGSSSATQPGHITEMAKKDLSGTGGSKNSDPYKLLEQRGIKPTLSSEERAAADAYGMVAKAGNKTVNKTSSGADDIIQYEKLKAQYAADEISHAERIGSGLKPDPTHRAASYLSQEQLAKGRTYSYTGGDDKSYTLLQTKGQYNGKDGVYEYITNSSGQVTHQRFIEDGTYTGFPNQKVK